MVEACGESRGLETGIAQRTRTHSLFMIMHSIFHFLIEYKLIMYTDINTPSKNNDKVNYVHTIHLWLLSQGADNSSTHFKEFHGIVSLGATGSAQFSLWGTDTLKVQKIVLVVNLVELEVHFHLHTRCRLGVPAVEQTESTAATFPVYVLQAIKHTLLPPPPPHTHTHTHLHRIR